MGPRYLAAFAFRRRLFWARHSSENPLKAAALDLPASIPSQTAAKSHVWALTGHRVGDAHQVVALARALGGAWEEKRLDWVTAQKGWRPFYGARPTLAPLTADARARITPPWPDIVLSIGWRSVPVARWIGQASGARLVHLGRPRAPLTAFDLVLTTPQYQVPPGPNVIELAAPLSRLSASDLEEAARLWQPKLAALPRPWIAVIVGGTAKPYLLDLETARDLGEKASAEAKRQGGSLLIATSPRTGIPASKVLADAISVPNIFYEWDQSTDNPYLAFLALADGFIVTNDSISMMHETSLTGRPVTLYPLAEKHSALSRVIAGTDAVLRGAPGPVSRFYHHALRQGWVYGPRRADLFSDRLLQSGRASLLGDTAPEFPHKEPGDEIERAVAAVRKMMAGPRDQ